MNLCLILFLQRLWPSSRWVPDHANPSDVLSILEKEYDTRSSCENKRDKGLHTRNPWR